MFGDGDVKDWIAVICSHLNIPCRNSIVWEDLLSFLRWDFRVSLWRQSESASAVMRCECFCRHHHLILHQNRTSLVCQLVLRLLHYRWAFEFQNEESLRRLIRMRRTLVLLIDLLMESRVACFLALLLVWDYEMFARLERRVISGETGTGVDQMPGFDVWQWSMICHSHSSRLRRGVSLCRWGRLDQREGLRFDLEGYAYFCIRWRSSHRVVLASDLPFFFLENSSSKVVLYLSRRDGDVTLWIYTAWAMAKCQKRSGISLCSIIARALCRRLFTAVSAAPTE